MQSKKLTVLTESEYFKQITAKIARAQHGEKILLTTMAFDPTEKPIHNLMRSLIMAASQGANVTLLVDAIAFMLNEKTGLPSGPLILGKSIHSTSHPFFKYKIKMLEKLKGQGGRYEIINTPSTSISNPYARRSHIKMTIINDELYVSGCNLGGSNEIDLVTNLKDKNAAKWLYKIGLEISDKKDPKLALFGKDVEYKIDNKSLLLVDCGVPGQSLIFDKAIDLIDQAKDWLLITCQFFPNSLTAKHLAAAHKRGVKVRVFYNHPNKHEHIYKIAHRLVVLQEKVLHPKALFINELPKKHRRLHAKLIATEQGAIIGSHNYVTAGVKLGTAEAAILSHDPDFAEQAVKIILPKLTK